jgi:hypothetical protein
LSSGFYSSFTLSLHNFVVVVVSDHDEQSLCDAIRSPGVSQRTESPCQVNVSLEMQECNIEESNENDQRTCELCLRSGDRTAKDVRKNDQVPRVWIFVIKLLS